MLWQEPWILDCEAFDGAWLLADGGAQSANEMVVVGVARLLVVRIVANAVRRQMRSEDLRDDVAAARAYLADLELDARDRRGLDRLLAAVTPYDPERITDALLAECAAARAGGLDGTARCFAELAYETAAAHGLNADAQGAALALARLATLQECPRTARRWYRLGHAHGRRAVRKRFATA